MVVVFIFTFYNFCLCTHMVVVSLSAEYNPPSFLAATPSQKRSFWMQAWIIQEGETNK